MKTEKECLNLQKPVKSKAERSSDFYLDFFVLVNSLVRNETKHGIDSDRVVVGGFSQGCVISLLSGLRLEHKLAGIVGYSGWVALKNETEKVFIKKKCYIKLSLIKYFRRLLKPTRTPRS